jgi:hypothetical protein
MTIDHAWYLEQNPDVAKAAQGAADTHNFAQTHYDNFGRFEGRAHSPNLNEVIAEIYTKHGAYNPTTQMAPQGTRVLTQAGNYYDVTQDPHTAELIYTRAHNANNFSTPQTRGFHGPQDIREINFGNRYHRRSVYQGKTFNYGLPTPTEFPNYGGTPPEPVQIFTPEVQGGGGAAAAPLPDVAPLSLTAARRGQSAGDAGVQIYGGGAGNRVVY